MADPPSPAADRKAARLAAAAAKEAAQRAKRRAANQERVAKQRAKHEAREMAREDAARARRAKLREKAIAAEARESARHAREKAAQDRRNQRSLKGDKARKGLLDALVALVLLLLVGVVAAAAGLVQAGIAVQTYALAAATLLLAGGTFLFTTIRWEQIQGEAGRRILDRGRADLVLTLVSISSLLTVIAMAVVEVFALLVYTGLLANVGAAGAGFAHNFVLFQTIMLLVYLMAVVVRQNNPSRAQPGRRVRLAAAVLTPMAVLVVLAGAVLASGAVALGGIEPRQAVYIVTLGVLLEFIAMRIRLRLPSLTLLVGTALAEAKRPDPEMKDLLQRRALRTYVGAALFVAASMAAAATLLTNTVALDNAQVVVALIVFYVGLAVVLLGLLGVRLLQARSFHRPKAAEGDDLAALVGRRRRDPAQTVRIAVYSLGGVLAAAALVLSVASGFDAMPWHAKYATDFFILAVMFAAGPYGFFFNRELSRIAAIDAKFPDFLRDIAESARAGMTLPRALVTAAQGTYGALTPEIKTMAAQVEWGVDFGDALARFAQRCQTPLIDRTVALVIEAQRSGGSVVDVLTAASEDAREIKQILSERAAQMSMYNVVVYISFFVFIVVVMVLSAQFIPAFKTAVGAASGQQVGGLQFKDFDPEDFNTAFFQAALVQAIGGGLVGGVLTKGTPVAGFMHVAIMMAVAWLSFRVIYALMTGDPQAAADAKAVALVWGLP